MWIVWALSIWVVSAEDTTQWIEWKDFEALDVKASDWETVLFTIMDRNLGATEPWTWVDSYGYFYQWWNNYGFSSEAWTYPANSGTELVDITWEWYGPWKYYSSDKFIKRTTSPYRWDTDESNETYTQYWNLNLWWWEKVYNPDIDRRGPCPAGYHVPDMFEWKAARETWCREKMWQANGQCSNWSNFRDDLLLPFAGGRLSYDASVYNQGGYGRYWSSSPLPSNASNSYYLYFDSSNISPQSYNYRAYGYSVRCFKDSQNTQTLTFDADNGEDNVVYNIRWWEPITKSHNFTPEKEWYKFVWWYNWDEKFNFSDSTFINESTVLTAKWVIEDTTQWVEWEDFEPLEVKASDGQTVLFTIMDRNLWATESWTICNSTNTWACGYYYQWWNNYGFSSEPWTYPANSSRDLVDITGEWYGPWKYYKSSTFIKRTTSPYRWDTDESNETYTQYWNLNLWWWEKVYNPDIDRRGPCPAGYHVPDMFEWKAARETWCREKMWQANGQCSNWSNFRDDLLLPFAGGRLSYDASVYNQGGYGRYWSSSPLPSNASNSYYLYFDSSNISPQSYNYRAYGYSVRCFKDSQNTQTLTFDADNGEDNVVYNIRWWEPITKSHNFTPEKEWYKFVWWYNWDEKFNFSDSTFINESTVLTAKWVIEDTTQWVEWEDFEPLEVKASDGQTVLFTIMDRNLWATESWTICNSTNTWACGYYYQWWNNYGFSSEPWTYPANSSRDLVDITGEWYGPWKYYKSSTFIERTTSPYRWDTDNSNETYQQYWNLNLWWWEKVYNPDRDRQWPCPSWYHVPDMLEWKAAREAWCREKMWQANGQCNNWTNLRDDLLLPFAGNRNNYDASIGSQGGDGRYWSSSPLPSDANASYSLRFSSSNIYPQYDGGRPYGLTVRCFKDSQSTQTLTFDADNWEDNVVYNIRWWEPITKSYKIIPEKEWYKFVGWYEWDAEFNFSDTTFITENTVLNAKWEKYPWFTYDANGGVFADQSSQNVIKYSKIREEIEYQVSKSYGYKKIEWAPKLYVTAVMIENSCGGWWRVYLYDYEKNNSSAWDDYVVEGKYT